MKEEVLYQFINELPIPCSLLKLITNEEKQPYDCLFLCVNIPFKSMFPHLGSDLEGNTIRSIKSLGENIVSDWISMSSNSVLNNGIYELPIHNSGSHQLTQATIIKVDEDLLLAFFTYVSAPDLKNLQLEMFFTGNLDLMCIASIEGIFIKVNSAFEHVFGYSYEEFQGSSCLNFVHKSDITSTLSILQKLKKQNPIIKFTNRFSCKDGSFRYIEWKSFPLGSLIYSSGRDITREIQIHEELNLKNQQLTRLTADLKAANLTLERKSVTDRMTGLKNRDFFDERIMDEFEYSERSGEPISMIIYDIDHFKQVNDTYGHLIGDEILKQHSYILSQFTREKDMAIRMGGEEFALLMPNTTLKEAISLAVKIKSAFETHVHPIAGKVTASFGVAQRAQSESVLDWYRRIDSALYTAKNNGRNQVIAASDERFPYLNPGIRWNKKWNSGESKIDSQHREMFNLALSIFQTSYENGDYKQILPSIEKLIDLIIEHFDYEESILNKTNYEEFQEHAEIHKKLISTTMNLKQELLLGKIKPSVFFSYILDEVIIAHLTDEDTKFFYLFESQPTADK